MKTNGFVATALSALLAVTACASPDGEDRNVVIHETNNAALGIARFVTEETDLVTTVIGFDANGVEVGRLELVHGRFVPDPDSYEYIGSEEVDGRSVKVNMQDGTQFLWQNIGYHPTMTIPALDDGTPMLKAFVAEPIVKQVMADWKWGFGDEDPYTSYTYAGYNFTDCGTSTTCGATLNGTAYSCGGSPSNPVNAVKSGYIEQGTGCGQSEDQLIVAQWCPNGNFSRKSCPTTAGDNTGLCGTRTSGACVGCGGVSSSAGAQIFKTASSAGTCGAPVNMYARDNSYLMTWTVTSGWGGVPFIYNPDSGHPAGQSAGAYATIKAAYAINDTTSLSIQSSGGITTWSGDASGSVSYSSTSMYVYMNGNKNVSIWRSN